MQVSDHCKIGKLVSYDGQAIIEGLRNNLTEKGIWYVVTTAAYQRGILYVLSRHELANGLYPIKSLRAVAIAGSKKEAFSLVTELIQEASDKNSMSDLKQFFENY